MQHLHGHEKQAAREDSVRTWRILVVDDNPGDRRIYRAYLDESTEEAYRIWEAETAEAGLEICELVQPDCVLLDYGLPTMTGLDMLKAVGARHGDIPFAVLMLTGNRDSKIVAESLRHGAQDYLVKEITTPAYLERAVQNAIQKFALERQKKEAEQALRQSEQRFRNAFASAAIGMRVADLDGRLIEVNDAYCRITGYTRDELIGKSFVEFTHPEDIEGNLAAHQQLLRGEKTSYVIEKRYIRRCGEIVWVRNSVSVVRDRSGNPIQTIALSEDVSAKRQLEEQLRQAQKMEAIGRFAAGVAHDFNNLLTVVIGYADLVSAHLSQEPALRSEVDEIRRAGERGASLVAQLLAFSRQQLLRPEVIDCNEVIRGVEKLMRRLIGEDIEMLVALTERVGLVKTDRTQIEQVLMNLAANARDAMPKGGRLRIETKAVHIDEPAPDAPDLRAGHYLLLSVSDSGHGMDADTASRIFEPFFTTKGRGQGTGLGLASVYGSVKQSGGTIVVETELDRGTTFKIYLPITAEQIESGSAPAAAPRPRRPATILLVEDDPAIRAFLRSILADEGFAVLDCEAAADAMHLASKTRFDLLLTDVVLSDTSGPELADKIRLTRPETKVLYMSGYTDHALFRQSTVLEGTTLLHKPFTRRAVLDRVGEVLAAD